MSRAHGLSRHPLINIWRGILDRCENPRNPAFHWYGGRGIRVCERWHDIRLFVEDIERLIGPRPEGMSLDRVDNDRGYEPGNVQWATPYVQAKDQRQRARIKVARVTDGLGGMIERGELRPGQKLPSEINLAFEWDVAYFTARRAISELKARGLIESRQGKGTFVARNLPGG